MGREAKENEIRPNDRQNGTSCDRGDWTTLAWIDLTRKWIYDANEMIAMNCEQREMSRQTSNLAGRWTLPGRRTGWRGVGRLSSSTRGTAISTTTTSTTASSMISWPKRKKRLVPNRSHVDLLPVPGIVPVISASVVVGMRRYVVIVSVMWTGCVLLLRGISFERWTVVSSWSRFTEESNR